MQITHTRTLITIPFLSHKTAQLQTYLEDMKIRKKSERRALFSTLQSFGKKKVKACPLII